MTKTTRLMKECAKLALGLEPKPDYPIQLFYADGLFAAMFEPNLDSVLSAEAPTAEGALEKLRDILAQPLIEEDADGTPYLLSKGRRLLATTILYYHRERCLSTKAVAEQFDLRMIDMNVIYAYFEAKGVDPHAHTMRSGGA